MDHQLRGRRVTPDFEAIFASLQVAADRPVGGNRCGHDPRNPRLEPAHPIRKGKGGLPRILSLAAERTKAWHDHPQKCPFLLIQGNRKTRSERREACLVVLETLLSYLDLVSLCLGVPILANGFIDIDMKTIVRDTGLASAVASAPSGSLERPASCR